MLGTSPLGTSPLGSGAPEDSADTTTILLRRRLSSGHPGAGILEKNGSATGYTVAITGVIVVRTA